MPGKSDQINCQTWNELASPDIGSKWIRPAQGKPAMPVWGHAFGLQVGLAPMPGPRGLLRIYAPYLGLKEGRMINFIAVEPIPEGSDERGFSELEMSRLDNCRGKRFWSSDDSLSHIPLKAEIPARGVINIENNVETLSVFVFVEPFENGAKVFLKLRFFSDRPYEVEISTFSWPDSKKLAYCIATATMGNLPRLRTLYLSEKEKSAEDLWPEFSGEAFSPHAVFPVNKMIKDSKNNFYFIASPEEEKSENVIYSPGTNDHWKYEGEFATQYWYVNNPNPSLVGLVNGRAVYWASKSPIPGGIAFENFELKEPFRNGASFVFGVVPSSPGTFIEKLKD